MDSRKKQLAVMRIMEKISDYHIIEKVSESPRSFLYRCRKGDNEQTVVLKVMKMKHASPAEISRLK